jgi:type I restriction enzyme S subunit
VSIERTAPRGWDIARLEDVVDILDSKRVPINAKERETRVGQVPYYGATGQVGWIDDYLFDEELVLLGEDGAPFLDATKQKAYVVRGKSWVNNHAHVLRARSDIPNAYIKYYLDTVDYHEFVTGTTRLKLNQAAMRRIPVPLAPPNERARIVAEIEKQFSRLDEAVANLKRVKANLKRYKAAVLKAAVEGKLAPTERPWKQVLLGDIATSIRNGYSEKPDAEQGTRIFRISAVRPMKLDVNDVRYLSGTLADYQTFLIESGDVLFTRYNGNRDYVGVCARVPASLPPTVYPDKLIRVRVQGSMVLPEFLVILASAGRARQYIESKIRTTAGQSGISGGDLKSLPLDIPRMAEQHQIVAEVERHLSVIEELESAVEANLTRADRLRQSILATAFAGKLVITNPSRMMRGGTDIKMTRSLQ